MPSCIAREFKEGPVSTRAKQVASIVVALLAAVSVVLAEEAAPAAKSPWSGSLGLSYVATSGNSDASTFGGDLVVKREPLPWGIEAGLAFIRAEQNSVTTAERYAGRVRGLRSLNERWQVFVGANGEQDKFAGFDLRTVLETGAIYKALLGPKHQLAFDGGVSWTKEEYTTDLADYDYLGGLLGLAYTWAISETASLSERLVWYPNFDNSDDWRATSETAVQANMTKVLALKAGYLWRYDNVPVPGLDDTDTTTTLSVVLTF